MPLDLLLYLVYSLFDLVRGSFVLSLPIYPIVLAGIALRRFLERKYKLNWIKSSIAATFAIMLILVLALNLAFPLLSLGEVTVGQVPPGLETPIDALLVAALSLLRIAVVAAVLTALLFPLEIAGTMLFEKSLKKIVLIKSGEGQKLNYIINAYIAVFVMTLLSTALLLFLFPWAITGIIYLVFFGPG